MNEHLNHKASLCKGLTKEQAELSAERHGRNRLSEAKRKSFIGHFLSNLGDPVIRILLAALCVDLFFVFRGGDMVETCGIALSVFLATLISTLSERGSDAAFRRLSEECERASYAVFRDGALTRLNIEDIVVGDVILLHSGESVPADGYLTGGSLTVDQSAMTGENKEIKKYPEGHRSPAPDSPAAVFRGSVVLSGEATVEIFAVGDNSFLGRISDEIQTPTRDSPLKVRLAKLAKQISRLGYIAAVLVAFAYLFNNIVIASSFRPELISARLSDTPALLSDLLHAFMLGLTVIVVAVPEGLPMMIAVVLSSNTRRMIKDKVLVRTPAGIEAAGSMNILLTDKTGTLTEGKMSVESIILPSGELCASFSALSRTSPHAAELYRLSCLFNTEVTLTGDTAFGGNSTDRALAASAKSGALPDKRLKAGRKLPFDSSLKYSGAEVIDPSAKERIYLIKGAPDRLMPRIKSVYTPDGKTVSFSQAAQSQRFSEKLSKLAREGKRLLLIARSDRMPSSRDAGELTLICAVAICDKQRKDAARSVAELKSAGVQVVMITGDGRETADAIARSVGILDSSHNVSLTGEELSKMSDEELTRLIPRLAVVSRALPTDKSRLVRLAQEMELVVGMTGDGINDAPALRRADVGFAMGSGTGVAKAAGDVIILDDRLASIARAVLYGRNIFKSIRKFITLQLTMNFSAVGISMICPFLGYESPITVTQMLWINVIMDTLGGLAFAGEHPLPSYMREPPKKRDEPILNPYMINQIVFLGGFTVLLCLAFLLSPSVTGIFRYARDDIYLLTAFFALYIFTSVLACFSARSDRLNILSGLGKNHAFIIIMSVISVTQILFIYLGGALLRTAPLTARELSFTLLLSLPVIPADIIRKLILRSLGKKKGF